MSTAQTKEKATFISMGCRLNIAETETMREQMPAGDEELVVINSCAVTNEAVRQTRQAIRKARRANPEAKVVVTGCAAQIDPESFAAMPEVDRVLGNIEKIQPDALSFDAPKAETLVQDIMQVRETAPHMASAFADHARAFVEVQNGCDHRCTFCIIPYGRGNSRSVPAGRLVEHVQELVDKGYQEVVLTGVDVTSYGHDLPGQPNLGMLVERILKHVPALPRLRLSSLDGVEVDDRLFDLITGDERVMPHVHISLQSGDDMILKRMKRRHNRAQAIDLVERLKARRPEIAIGADIIAGFPTETEEMHANNCTIISECQIVHGHIFPYSPREGTPAARMPQVDRATIKSRAKELRELTAAQRSKWLESQIGSSANLLVEKDGVSGHIANFAPIRLATPAPSGQIKGVTITGVSNGRLDAEIIEERQAPL
ncbi:MAG: tRNA (N(6)-L-threonylcarbamoyladenosine(37)-C(2))-methylthiotransferase MtaB [Pseudomonadota bacterium]